MYFIKSGVKSMILSLLYVQAPDDRAENVSRLFADAGCDQEMIAAHKGAVILLSEVILSFISGCFCRSGTEMSVCVSISACNSFSVAVCSLLCLLGVFVWYILSEDDYLFVYRSRNEQVSMSVCQWEK